MAGPQAAAGESLDELCAALGVMANMGVKGSLAGTALRKAYVQFADVKVQKTLREVGVEVTDTQIRFNEAMKAQAVHQIEAEIAELKNNISELEKESKSMTDFWVNTWNMITFHMGKSAREINANSDKIADARRRLAAIEEGDEEALTGGKTEHEKQEEKVKRHGPRRPCCPSRAAARDSRRRRFAAHVSACRLRIHAHGR